MRLLAWDAIDRMSLEAFRNNYYEEGGGFVTIRGKVQWSNRVRNVPCNMHDLNYRLRHHLMVRRTRDQVLKELPPCAWHPFPLATTPAMRKALSHPGWKRAEKLYEMDEHAFDQGIPIDGEISTARRLLGEAKAPAIADYIEDLLASGITKLVVAAWHHSVLDYLRDRLSKYGLVYMDGGTSPTRKQAAVDAFQLREDIGIILGQAKPLGEGWTLTEAQDLVHVEPDWVPGRNDQLLYRISRMGQTGSYTLGHLPVVPGTMDERVLGTAISKDKNIYEVLDAVI